MKRDLEVPLGNKKGGIALKLIHYESIDSDEKVKSFLWYSDYLRLPSGISLEIKSYHTKDFVILKQDTILNFGTYVSEENFRRIPEHFIPDFRNADFVENVCLTFRIFHKNNKTDEFYKEPHYTKNLKDLTKLNPPFFIRPIITKTVKKENFSEEFVRDFMIRVLKILTIFETVFVLPFTTCVPYVPIESKEELLEFHKDVIYQKNVYKKNEEEEIKEIEEFYQKASFEDCKEEFKNLCLEVLGRDEEGLYSLCLSAYRNAMEALERLRIYRIKRRFMRHAWIELPKEETTPYEECLKKLNPRREGKY